jgi:methylisocitrate lyase
MPGAFNAYTARLIERAGFEACYVSGAGLTNATAGVPDIGLLGLEEFARLAGYIAQAVRIPVVADADTGFGGPSNAARTVRMYESAGLAGLHLEDQQFPKRCGHLAGKELVPVEEMVEKLRAALSARRDPGFFIIARTDARAVEGLDAAISRAQRYLDAGADGVFPEALETADEFKVFAREVRAPLMANMTEFGKSPLIPLADLGQMGFEMAIYPQTAFRVGSFAAAEALRDLREKGSQVDWLQRMQPRDELYKTLGYDPKADVWIG